MDKQTAVVLQEQLKVLGLKPGLAYEAGGKVKLKLNREDCERVVALLQARK